MANHRNIVCISFVFLMGLLVAGCSSAVRKPRLRHPGPAAYQQYHATQFDPYPQNDVGPEILGGRPRTYMLPPPEVVRARQHHMNQAWRGAAR